MARARQINMNTNAEIDCLLEKAWSLRLKDSAESKALSLQAKAQCEATGYEHGLIFALRNLGELHMLAHEYEAALTTLNEAFSYLENLEDVAHSAAFELYLQASAIHTRLGNSPTALSYCYQAAAIAQKENSMDRQAFVYKTMGNTQMLFGEYETAVASYQQGLTLYTQAGDKTGMVTIYNNMCHTFHQNGQLDEALTTGLAGLKLYSTFGETHEIPRRVYAYNLNNVGITYLKRQQYEVAASYFEKAFTLFRQESDLYGETYSLRGLAQVNMHHQKYDEAFAQFEEALALAKKSEIMAELVQCHLALANAYKETGQFQQALFHHEKFYEYEKSIINDKAEKKIRNLEANYKLQEAQQETELYQLKNEALREEVKRRQKAEWAAEAAARAKSEFLANMSHEIRTPLNGIISVTELLRQSGLTEHQQELSQIIQTSGESLLRIINDILDFSKIESGKLELEKMPYLLRQAVETAVALLTPKAADKQLDIGYIMDTNVPDCIVGDRIRFQQILVNLLNNGIKFTEQGEVFVHVQCTHQEEETAVIHVTVEDTGIGIDAASCSRLFQPFSQGDASITRKYGGTGLGLAISKQLTELMGGEMWVESEPGQGSAFHFTIKAPVMRSGTTPLEENSLAGKSVLVVMNSDNQRHAVEKSLRILDMTPLMALNSTQAVMYARQQTFATILIEQEPTISDTLPQLLHTALGSKCPPLLAVTSQPAKLADNTAFAGVLGKPVKLVPLRRELQKIVTKVEKQAPQGRVNSTQYLAHAHPLAILVAEDNKVNQKVAQFVLGSLGYEPAIAANGLEVLAMLKERPFDVVLMDIQMPEMDGITATLEIQQQFGAEERPYIIAMTAHALTGDREKLIKAGMDDYISKPVSIENLANILKKVTPRPLAHNMLATD